MSGDAGADLALVGGSVITLDDTSRVAQAVAIRRDRILAVGADAEIRGALGPRARVVDLRGRAVVPGLVDAHAHMDREGLKTLLPSLAGARSIDDVLQRIEALARDAEPGRWIVTMPIGDPPEYRGVPGVLREGRFPTRHELDRVAPRNPVYIRSIWGYWRHTLPLVSVANTEALRLAGVTRDTLPPWSGIQIDKDWATGEPTGVFVEWTYVPLVELTLMAAAPRFTHAERVRALAESMRVYRATGTTSVFEGHGIADEVARAYREARDAGAMTVRAHLVVSPSWSTARTSSLSGVLGSWPSWPAGRGLGDAYLRAGGLFAELGTTADNEVRARALPYTGWAGFNCDAGLPRERLLPVLVEAARRDIRVVAIGAGALPLYEEVDRAVPLRDRRWVIAHVSLLTPEEIARIRDLGVMVTTHTNRYIAKEGGALRAQVGAAGEDTIVPLRRLVDAGVPVALATDNVPTTLWQPVWHAVARRDRATGAVVAPAQCLSRLEALRAATVAGARLTFEEREKGTIEPGKLADLLVCSRDPFAADESALAEIVSEMTIVGGRIVHEVPPPGA